MNNWIKVARVHLIGGLNFLVYPWIILVLNFFIAIVVNQAAGGGLRSGELGAIYAAFLAMGVMAVVQWMPFMLALGVSRRSYFMGVTLVALGVSALDGLALAVLQLLERGTGGWGATLHFFRVPYLLTGPWYLTWLTSFVLLTVCFVWGMWFGIVYRRWSLAGLMTFIAAQTIAIIAGIWIATSSHAWTSIGHFFTVLSVEGLTGLVAALGLLLFAGGLATMRRVSV
jgi:hypothetical protein